MPKSLSHWWTGTTPRLPFELRIRIIEEVGMASARYPRAFDLPRYCLRTLLSLSLVNKAFHKWTEPILYRHVTVGLLNIIPLYETLYQKAHRPPLPPLARNVESLRIVQPVWSLTYTSEREDEYTHVEYVLSHVMENLKQLCMGVALTARMRDTIEAMPNLETLAMTGGVLSTSVFEQNPYPVLPNSVRHYVIHLGYTDDTTSVVSALAGSKVQRVVIPLPRMRRRGVTELISGLVKHCGMLDSIVIIPDSSEWIKGDGVNPVSDVDRLTTELQELETEHEIRQLMDADSMPGITLAAFPDHLKFGRNEDRRTWVTQMTAIGAIWDIEDETHWGNSWMNHRPVLQGRIMENGYDSSS